MKCMKTGIVLTVCKSIGSGISKESRDIPESAPLKPIFHQAFLVALGQTTQ